MRAHTIENRAERKMSNIRAEAVRTAKWTVNEHRCEGGYPVCALHAILFQFFYYSHSKCLCAVGACAFACLCLTHNQNENQSFVGMAGCQKHSNFTFYIQFDLLLIFIISIAECMNQNVCMM